ncbi:hypothetical protein MARINOS108_10223 [Marinoscillum sp. 108]|nr:hypothetical protein MARINOS108_10223 [Marinoscillum sp. 108]
MIDNHPSLGRTPLKMFVPDDSRFEIQTWGQNLYLFWRNE